MAKYRVGQRVYWTDEDFGGEGSGWAVVVAVEPPDASDPDWEYPGEPMYELGFGDIVDGEYTEGTVEAYEHEITEG